MREEQNDEDTVALVAALRHVSERICTPVPQAAEQFVHRETEYMYIDCWQADSEQTPVELGFTPVHMESATAVVEPFTTQNTDRVMVPLPQVTEQPSQSPMNHTYVGQLCPLQVLLLTGLVSACCAQ